MKKRALALECNRWEQEKELRLHRLPKMPEKVLREMVFMIFIFHGHLINDFFGYLTALTFLSDFCIVLLVKVPKNIAGNDSLCFL